MQNSTALPKQGEAVPLLPKSSPNRGRFVNAMVTIIFVGFQ